MAGIRHMRPQLGIIVFALDLYRSGPIIQNLGKVHVRKSSDSIFAVGQITSLLAIPS